MANHEPADVLIAGAGPTGLILAHELLRRGVRVRLAEKRPGPSHTTRAFTLHARTMEMFEHIGVAHRLEEVCLPCPGNIYHFQGMPADQLPRTDFRTLPSRYAFYYKLNQNDFEQVLREHLHAQYSLVPEYGTEVVALTETGGQVATQLRRTGYRQNRACLLRLGRRLRRVQEPGAAGGRDRLYRAARRRDGHDGRGDRGIPLRRLLGPATSSPGTCSCSSPSSRDASPRCT